MENPLIVVLGPTASGKTKLAASLARHFKTEIISADSRQVFRDMNIGTGKDYEEYHFADYDVPVHLIDILEAGDEFYLTAYIEQFHKAFDLILKSGKVPVLCGGTGLYIEAVLKGFAFPFVPIDPTLRDELEPLSKNELEEIYHQQADNSYKTIADISTSRRLIRAIEIGKYLIRNSFYPKQFPTIHPIILGINPELGLRRKRIEDRLKQRMDNGLIEEVEELMKTLSAAKLISYGLEYKFIVHYLEGKYSKAELTERLCIAIQQYAKRQMTYFRKMEKGGIKINWLNNTDETDSCFSLIDQFLHG